MGVCAGGKRKGGLSRSLILDGDVKIANASVSTFCIASKTAELDKNHKIRPAFGRQPSRDRWRS